MRPTCDIEALFPPLGRHAYLDGDAVRRLVMGLGGGVAASIEKRGSAWRLRVRIAKPGGKLLRRGVTLPDEATAEWARDYLAEDRRKRTGASRREDQHDE